jgi:hypothetical protein
MNDILREVFHGLSVLLVLGLSFYWVVGAMRSALVRKWNDFCYSLSILLIMWSGLDLAQGIVAVFAVMWAHWYIAKRESGDGN